MADDYTDEPMGFMDRLKESPRTVSALIIILIVAAAIYAFSGDQATDNDLDSSEAELASEVNSDADREDGEEAIVEEGSEDEATTEETIAASTAPTPSPVSQDTLQEEKATLPEVTVSDTGIEEVAQAGDGLTHLARRATTRWLSENSAGYEVTNEHRIYIEDYIRKNMDQGSLGVGETRMISFDLIQEAVAAAGELSPTQLNNLTQYTYVL